MAHISSKSPRKQGLVGNIYMALVPRRRSRDYVIMITRRALRPARGCGVARRPGESLNYTELESQPSRLRERRRSDHGVRHEGQTGTA